MPDNTPPTPLEKSLLVVEAMKQAYLDGILSVDLPHHSFWGILERASRATSPDDPFLQQILELQQKSKLIDV